MCRHDPSLLRPTNVSGYETPNRFFSRSIVCAQLGVVGRATDLHYDHPFFARGSNRIHTVWSALRDIPVTDGPLVVVEGSHRFGDLIEPVLAIDYESKDSPQVAVMNAIEVKALPRTYSSLS